MLLVTESEIPVPQKSDDSVGDNAQRLCKIRIDMKAGIEK